ncbi:hypothetical protein B9479_005152 [Cryptococcus floricola]|uniref:Uncharacterized protein n=1 Tax=Cryptococcus floricola TaxID=2591691 RepID=A0A5D3AWK1_9TREE|nr:hypothetical protein B9479_005152 [Cryptococcus floricola]
MSAPNKPLQLDPSQIYLQVSHSVSQPPPNPITKTGHQLRYVGQVGELEGEGVWQVIRPDGQVVKRGEEDWTKGEKSVVEEVKKLQGVKGVKVMPEVKQRPKRSEF